MQSSRFRPLSQHAKRPEFGYSGRPGARHSGRCDAPDDAQGVGRRAVRNPGVGAGPTAGAVVH